MRSSRPSGHTGRDGPATCTAGGPGVFVRRASALSSTGAQAPAALGRRGSGPARSRSAQAAASEARHGAVLTRARDLVDAIRDGDDTMVEEAVLRLSRSRRWLAPLAL